MDLSQVVGGSGGNALMDSYHKHKNYYYYGFGALGVAAIVITIGMVIAWYYHEKYKNDRWYDENPKEKLFVIEVIDNNRPITPEQIKEQYGIDEQRANFLVEKHHRR